MRYDISKLTDFELCQRAYLATEQAEHELKTAARSLLGCGAGISICGFLIGAVARELYDGWQQLHPASLLIVGPIFAIGAHAIRLFMKPFIMAWRLTDYMRACEREMSRRCDLIRKETERAKKN